MYLPLLLSALALLISVLSFFYYKSYLKRRTGQKRILAEFQDEVNAILKSLNATVDRDISLIEEKEKALRDFLVDVDKRLKVYFRELEGREETEMKYASLSKKKPVTYGELGKNCFRRTTDMVQEKAPSAGAEGPTDTPVSVSDPKASSPSIDEQIHSLVRSGLSSAEIASRLGISISAVEFATALQERRNT